jgi:hypothetical protein
VIKELNGKLPQRSPKDGKSAAWIDEESLNESPKDELSNLKRRYNFSKRLPDFPVQGLQFATQWTSRLPDFSLSKQLLERSFVGIV